MAKKKPRTGLPRELDGAGALCLAFANTAAPSRDDRRRDPAVAPQARLATYADLLTWVRRMGTLGATESEQLDSAAAGRPEEAAVVLAGALELRAALMRIFTAVAIEKECQATDLATLNAALRARHVVLAADGFGRHWPGDPEALDRPLWPIAQSAAELLSCDRRRKIRQCAAKGCRRLFVYAHGQRRWCDPDTCGNRAKGRRYHDKRRRARKRALERAKQDQARRLAEARRMKAEKGEVAELDHSEVGV